MNFGWALTPMPNSIPSDGATIVVYIDGLRRPAITGRRGHQVSLPGRANSDAAVGFPVRTTTLANGVHTIAWAVTDSGGNSEGIGSRFFSVANNTTTSSLTLERSSSAQSLAASVGGAPLGRDRTREGSPRSSGSGWRQHRRSTAAKGFDQAPRSTGSRPTRTVSRRCAPAGNTGSR